MRTSLVPEEILQCFFGEERHQLELVSTARFGASGPKVVFFRNGGPDLFALKYGRTRVPISVQLENRRTLAEFLPDRLPQIRNYCRYSEGEAMLMEAIEGPNLHEAVMLGVLPDQQVLGIVQSIIADFRTMWVKSRSQAFSFTITRDPKRRLDRVRAAVFESLKDHGILLDDRVVINETEVGTAASLLAQFDQYVPPAFSVVCHSDLNADNIVIVPIDGRWYIVDWEWVGRHDWRLCLSHLYGWWSSNATRLEMKPSIRREKNRVELSYELSMPGVCEQIQKLCLHSGQDIANLLGDEEKWQRQFYILLAALLAGDIRFVKDRGREEYTIPLLGEGLRILANLAMTE